jgi:hypothetical protein
VKGRIPGKKRKIVLTTGSRFAGDFRQSPGQNYRLVPGPTIPHLHDFKARSETPFDKLPYALPLIISAPGTY